MHVKMLTRTSLRRMVAVLRRPPVQKRSVLIALLSVSLVWALYSLSSIRTGDALPAGCESTGMVMPTISEPGTLPPVSNGDEVGYRVGAAQPNDPIRSLCALTDVDVYLKLPGAKSYKLICRIDQILEDNSILCPQRISYEVDRHDVEDGALFAQVRVIANLSSGSSAACITSDARRDPKRSSACVDATGVSIISYTQQ